MSPRDNSLPDDHSFGGPQHEIATGTLEGPIAVGGGPQPTTHGPRFPTPKKPKRPAPRHKHGEGVRCRLAKIAGETPRDLLKRPLWVPAILAPIQFSEDADFNEFVTLNAGMFATPMGGDKNARKFRDLPNLQGLTIYWDAPWLTEHGYSVNHVESTLFGILHAKRPVQMLLVDKHRHYQTTLLRMDVTFRSVAWEMRAGEPDTHYLTLAIREHRDMSQGRRGDAKGRKRGVHLPTKHRLRDTDTLASLSMEFYGTYSRWKLIRKANAISNKFGSHGIIVYNTRFVTGQKIKIPKIPKIPGSPHQTFAQRQGGPFGQAAQFSQGGGGAQPTGGGGSSGGEPEDTDSEAED